MMNQVKTDTNLKSDNLRKGDKFIRVDKGGSYVVEVHKVRRPSKYSMLLWVISEEHGKEIMELSRSAYVEIPQG